MKQDHSSDITNQARVLNEDATHALVAIRISKSWLRDNANFLHVLANLAQTGNDDLLALPVMAKTPSISSAFDIVNFDLELLMLFERFMEATEAEIRCAAKANHFKKHDEGYLAAHRARSDAFSLAIDLFEELEVLPAITLPGLKAKAIAQQWWATHIFNKASSAVENTIVRDLLNMGHSPEKRRRILRKPAMSSS